MKVIVIGGGAAGMIAAIIAAKYGNDVLLLEKTGSLGNKLKITGKGRCNLTFEGDRDNFEQNILNGAKFMYSSFENLNNHDLIKLFEDLGLSTKIERGGRIFPKSDNANEVVQVLENELKKYNVKVMYDARVEKIITEESVVTAVKLHNGKIIPCDKCIIATGGTSYKVTGSSGDGYELAKNVGHSVSDIKGGLVPLKSSSISCVNMQGLSLKNVKLKLIEDNDKVIFEDFGEMMFAHFGITGPIVLSASSILNRIKDCSDKLKNKRVYASIDLKPSLDFDTLDKRICSDFEKFSNKEFKNSLDELLPKKMIPEIIRVCGISQNEKVHQISKDKRQKLVKLLKDFRVVIDSFMPIDLAIITCGGVNLKEVNPKTMESKIIRGLYFAGEVLDIDAYTGGYNLQVAFSTGYTAGMDI